MTACCIVSPSMVENLICFADFDGILNAQGKEGRKARRERRGKRGEGKGTGLPPLAQTIKSHPERFALGEMLEIRVCAMLCNSFGASYN